MENLGLAEKAEELFLSASHTHFAPMTAPGYKRVERSSDLSCADEGRKLKLPSWRAGGARTIRRISGRWSRWCWNFFQLEIPERVKPRIPGMNICGREVKIKGRLCRIAQLDADDYKFLDDPEAALRELRKSGLRIDLFTFMQKLPETTPKYSYPMEWDNMAVLKVSTFEHWWTRQIRKNTRNKAKQAEKKGVVIREVAFDDTLARGICEIYNECPVRQERRFPHYGKSLETVRELSATYLASSVFVGAYVDDELVGFIKFVVDDTGTQAGMMHMISMIRHRDKSPMNALVAQAVRSCADRRISYLVCEKFAYGKKTQSTLSRFKERNAFERIDIPRYYVPLTHWGSLALSIKLHHRLADRLPEPLAARLRELRGAWYRRFQPESGVRVWR